MENAYETNQPEGNTKIPAIICTIITILVVIGLIASIIFKNPYYIIISMFLAAIYELWRTEGYYTKMESLGILVLVILEVLALKGIIKLDLAKELNTKEIYLAYRQFPLGDIRIILPIGMALVSLGLLWRTYGAYTKWLSILLVISSLVLLYLVNKAGLGQILQNSYWF
jgi:hypothetical protein